MVVKAELNSPSVPRPQQRGYHLAQFSPNTNPFQFVTACSVLLPGQTESAFIATRISDSCVEFTDADYRCLIWTGSDSSMTARFAFELRTAAGALIASGTLP